MSWIMIRGVMATMATIPKASVRRFPPTTSQAPIASGRRKVAVMGPEATPPESKAMEVKMDGTTKERPSAITYPGSRKASSGMPYSTRRMESPRESAIPMERPRIIVCSEIAPPVISSTCLFNTRTAGSALTIK